MDMPVMLIGYFTFKIKNIFRSCGNRVCLEAVKMTLWVVEATTEWSEKMKSKRAVRWHDLDKGNMVGRKHLTAKRYKGIPVELELIMALRLTGPRFSRQQSQSAANCLCGILAASVCTPRESQNQETHKIDRSKNRFCSASILKRRVLKQMSIFLVQPGNTWQWRQKPWTTKKNEARKKPRNCTRLHEIRKLGTNLF